MYRFIKFFGSKPPALTVLRLLLLLSIPRITVLTSNIFKIYKRRYMPQSSLLSLPPITPISLILLLYINSLRYLRLPEKGQPSLRYQKSIAQSFYLNLPNLKP